MVSDRWSNEDLASRIASNPSLRLSKESRKRRVAIPQPEPSGKSNKFHAERITVEGITFDSKAEAARYGELKILERAGVIVGLDMQVKYPLVVNGHLIANYVADFTYSENGKFIVEDVKSKPTKTPAYEMKKKLLKALFGYEIKET